MAALYKELQPIDSYKIRLPQPFSDYDRQLLTLFYQPLIGSGAMSLFMTLWADAERGDEHEYNHYHLMNILTLPLGPVFEARISLEAIGILRSYLKVDGETRSFIYELLPPLDAKAFFTDPLLSTFLFSKIGEQAYRNLRTRFAIGVEMSKEYSEVSRTFLDVYKPTSNGYSIESVEDKEIVGRIEADGIPFDKSGFDFDLLQSGLSEQMVPQSALASVSKEIIAKLAFLYSLTPLDMQKVVMMALDSDMQLPEARLRKSAIDFYKMSISKEAPVLQKVFMQTAATSESTGTISRDDELINYLDNTPPLDMLRDLNGKEPMSVDVQLAEKLVNTHELPIGVVNVLMQYVHIRNDGKITNNYVERIASHWMNKKVKTAREAMEFSRTEHDKYMQWKNEGQKPAAQKRYTNTREEKVPEWFFKKEEVQAVTTKKSTFDVEEERRKLLEELGVSGNGVK
ncbi:replication initiation and membrane attachment family protein [Sporosarcina sp. FA9]|uniref:replication initiation and membrane attachment family protein n=1 Tax=Sporosarcina sp. FA9 TaxID=3413030 RepID=UPI003F659D7E